MRGSVFLLRCNAVLYGAIASVIAIWGVRTPFAALAAVSFIALAVASLVRAAKENRKQDA